MFRQPIIVCLLLAVITALAFAPLTNAGFINYDDPEYVAANPHVLAGLTAEGFRWAFTTFHAGNWHPLTWISLMLDVQLLGADPVIFHVMNLLWHIANAVLVFALFRALTGKFWLCAWVAAIFAIHPLHVESVAWISERKDVVSTFCFLLALINYHRFTSAVANPKSGNSALWYALSLGSFALGLLAKPMLVTLPCVLLLLDWWPLQRWSAKKSRSLLLEKVPFFLVSAACAFATVVAQQRGGAVRTLEQFAIGERLSNAAVSYVRYLGKTFWPTDLAIFYPHPGAWPLPIVLLSVVLLVGISLAAWLLRGRYGWLFTGWFWFAGMLVPVSGVIQVGIQAMADRYMYVPLIGLSLAVGWSAWHLGISRPGIQRLLSVLGWGSVAICFVLTSQQAGFWRNDEALFRHTIQVTKDNALAHNNLADYLLANNRPGEAMPHYREVLRLDPKYYHALNNLGTALAQTGDSEQALASIRRAIEINTNYLPAYLNLADTLARMGRNKEAAAAYQAVLARDTGSAAAHNNWAGLLAREGRLQEAVQHYRSAVQVNPQLVPAWVGLARTLIGSGDLRQAAEAFATAVSLLPNDPQLRVESAQNWLHLGQTNNALQELNTALSLQPDFAAARSLLNTLPQPAQANP